MEINTNETLQAIKKDQTKLVTVVDTLVVKTQEDYERAAIVLAQLRDRSKRIEAKRVEYVKPLNDQVAMINGDFKQAAAPYVSMMALLKTKMTDYLSEQERIAKEKLKAEEAERKAEAARIAEAEGITKRQALAQIEKPTIEVAPTKVVTKAGTVKTRVITKFEIVDQTLVPLAFKIVDETLIRKAIASGVKKIEGVRIYEEKIIS